MAPGILEFPSGFVEVSDFEGNKLNLDRHDIRPKKRLKLRSGKGDYEHV
jgi:hypothetical protein